MAKFWTTEQVVQMTGAKAPQVHYFVRSNIVTPAQPPSRRGVSGQYDFRNLVEITVATEMLNSGIPIPKIGRAMVTLREHFPRLAETSGREQFAVLAVFGSGWKPGEASTPESVQIGPAKMLADFAVYVIHCSVNLQMIVTRLEAMTGEVYGRWL